MPVTNGIISAPIDFETAVARALGVANYDCGYLCYNKHGRTNKWSARKPLEGIDTPLELAESVFKANNFGLSVHDTDMSSVELNDLFILKDWEYVPPIEGQWARITDFDGYNHNAVSCLACDITKTEMIEPTNPSIDVTFNGNIPEADMKISDFGMFSGSRVVWGFAYRIQGTTNAQYVGWDENVGGTPTNPVSGFGSLTKTVQPGTYEVIGLIFRTNDKYYLIPNSYKVITVKRLTPEEYLKFYATLSVRVEIDSKNRVYCSVTCRNEMTQQRSIVYSYQIDRYNANGSNVARIGEKRNVTGTVASSSTVTFPLGDEIVGDEGLTRDESGVMGGYYLVTFTLNVDGTGYTIQKNEQVNA